jgi:hypothetical protein
MKRPTHWRTWEELASEPIAISLINLPIDYSVDFAVKETAEARARRIWGMKEPEHEPR